MANNNIEVNDSAIMEALNRMSAKEIDKCMRSAYAAGLNYSKKRILKDVSNHFKNKVTDNVSDMINAIQVVTKNIDGKLHLFGKRGGRSFLPIYAVGSKDRFLTEIKGKLLKKKRFIGKIKNHDFMEAGDWDTATKKMMLKLDKNIKKLYNG